MNFDVGKHGLCVITDERHSRGRSHMEVVRLALQGGATWIQFRDKELDDRSRYEVALELRDLTGRHSALFFVNDRPDIALVVGADGLHLGRDDLPVERVRDVVGPEMVIGVSARSAEEAVRAESGGADYVGVGPVFEARGTKPDAPGPQGTELIVKMRRCTSLPIVAIGGITPQNCSDALRAGADGVAVISAVTAAKDIVGTVEEFREVLSTTRRELA